MYPRKNAKGVRTYRSLWTKAWALDSESMVRYFLDHASDIAICVRQMGLNPSHTTALEDTQERSLAEYGKNTQQVVPARGRVVPNRPHRRTPDCRTQVSGPT